MTESGASSPLHDDPAHDALFHASCDLETCNLIQTIATANGQLVREKARVARAEALAKAALKIDELWPPSIREGDAPSAFTRALDALSDARARFEEARRAT